MSNSKWQIREHRQPQLFAASIQCPKPKVMQRLVWTACVVVLGLLVMSLTGCAWPPKRPCEPLALPSMPALQQPLPTVDYSISAGQSIKRWASELTGTLATSEP